MRVLVALLASMIVVSAVADEAPVQPESALLRAALVVSDLESSKRFYSHGLGYSIGFDGDITTDEVRNLLQLDATQTVHFVVLSGADTINGETVSSAMIGLMHVSNPELPSITRHEGRTIGAGEALMAIVTDNIELVYERLLSLDANILYAPKKSTKGTETELVVYDPDGIRIHVVEVTTPQSSD